MQDVVVVFELGVLGSTVAGAEILIVAGLSM